MKLNLKNPLLFFDIESTGLNVATDRIVEISALKVMPNGDQEIIQQYLFLPKLKTFTAYQMRMLPVALPLKRSLRVWRSGCPAVTLLAIMLSDLMFLCLLKNFSGQE